MFARILAVILTLALAGPAFAHGRKVVNMCETTDRTADGRRLLINPKQAVAAAQAKR